MSHSIKLWLRVVGPQIRSLIKGKSVWVNARLVCDGTYFQSKADSGQALDSKEEPLPRVCRFRKGL